MDAQNTPEQNAPEKKPEPITNQQALMELYSAARMANLPAHVHENVQRCAAQVEKALLEGFFPKSE